ncbi:MAG: hypothetical protein WAV09_01645 [Minisyncoccia bacterium]
MPDTKPVNSFDESKLSKKKLDNFQFVKKRIEQLQKTRKNHYGHDLDKIWADADRDYVPHRLNNTGKRVLVEEDESKGWRGTSSLVKLGSDNWQSDVSQSNVFIKIQTALGILIDQNPSGVLTATTKKHQATTELIRQLYQRSWEFARSRGQLQLFVFNLAKYGWAAARTYPLRIEREVEVLTEYNQEDPDKSVYEKKTVVEYNDIYRENLDPRNTWIDDMAKPNNPMSIKDWAWRKVYDPDVAEEEFGKYPLFAQAKLASGNTTETIEGDVKGGKEFQSENLMEVFFYENRIKDLFEVHINGVPVIQEPLPIADAKGNKKLSLWQTFWNLRHAESPYGIGIYEAIRFDQAMLDRIRNMTVDQLTMSIYKMFFYQGTQNLQETGQINITPGVGKQVIDPKNINWMEVPGPGQDAWLGIDMFRKDLDESSGITDPLIGVVTGKTAFEIAQAKESALKRMKQPLDNILEALNQEGYITISLIQLLYSIPETYQITDPALIDAYLAETGGDQSLYERGQSEIGENGEEVPGAFTAKVYPEFPLNLDKDDQDNLVETSDTQFFRVKPDFLNWEGIINVKAQSILTPSKQVDKALDLEFYNMLIPLLQNPPELYNKIAKEMCKLYDKDPKDVLPELWVNDQMLEQQQMAQQQAAEPLMVAGGGAPQAETMVSSPEPTSPTTLGGNIGNMMANSLTP